MNLYNQTAKMLAQQPYTCTHCNDVHLIFNYCLIITKAKLISNDGESKIGFQFDYDKYRLMGGLRLDSSMHIAMQNAMNKFKLLLRSVH